jgi:predicted dehydrogenase
MEMSEERENQDKKEVFGKQTKRGIDRRDLLQGVATLPVLGLFGLAARQQKKYENAQKAALSGGTAQPENLPVVNVAQIGVGAQGEVLRDAMLKIPNLKFRAVCDIWTEYSLKRTVSTYQRAGHDVKGYEDYREMLDKEKELDAVVIATPDFWHAEHAIACLQAGKHVYCEKEMSNTLESAKKMVLAARETGKLLQIGHQRRSNPRYLYCYNKIIKETNLLGRIVTINGQWNRAVQESLGFAKRYEIPESKLKQYGFKDMEQFRNWRWFKGLGGGPIVDLGSHQIDIYAWFLDSLPVSVMASGGNDYYPTTSHEWYDTAMVVYEFKTEKGPARAYYQTQTTNSSLGYYEKFMGDQGTLVLSESNANAVNAVYRESTAPAWDEWVQKGLVTAPKVVETTDETAALLDVRESVSPDEHKIPITFTDPYHKPHLQNFFNAVRGLEKLNCPAEVGYETAVMVLKVNEAIQAGKKIEFSPDEFKVS